MSTCPEKDIHSIYIDNELPQQYIAEYEEHVKNCPKCTAQLNKLRSIKLMLTSDSKELELDNIFLSQSLERLQSRMQFTSVVNASKKPQRVMPFVKWSSSVAAAAAVFAVIFIPIHTKAINAATQPQVNAISRASIETLPQNDVIIDGNISQAKLTSVFSDTSQKTVSGSIPVTNNANYSGRLSFNDVDFFRPDFSGRGDKLPPPPKPDGHRMHEKDEIIMPVPEGSGTDN